MGFKKHVLFPLLATLFLLTACDIFAQDINATEEQTPEEAMQTAVEPVDVPGLDAQLLWAEVVSVDADAGTISANYLEYETDSEQAIVFNTDDKTVYENAKSLKEISPKDTIGVDYVVSADGKNLATNISLEKTESITEEKIDEITPAEISAESESMDMLDTSPAR